MNDCPQDVLLKILNYSDKDWTKWFFLKYVKSTALYKNLVEAVQWYSSVNISCNLISFFPAHHILCLLSLFVNIST